MPFCCSEFPKTLQAVCKNTSLCSFLNLVSETILLTSLICGIRRSTEQLLPISFLIPLPMLGMANFSLCCVFSKLKLLLNNGALCLWAPFPAHLAAGCCLCALSPVLRALVEAKGEAEQALFFNSRFPAGKKS